MKKNPEHSLLDALFNIEPPKEKALVDLLLGKDGKSPLSSANKKRLGRSNKEECPVCGRLFPSGGVCPGCGLHDEEMPWREE